MTYPELCDVVMEELSRRRKASAEAASSPNFRVIRTVLVGRNDWRELMATHPWANDSVCICGITLRAGDGAATVTFVGGISI